MILLDTHAWIWWVSAPSRLGRTASHEIREARRIGVSAISCWELAMLARRGRIELDRPPLEWIEDALGLARVELVPLTPAISVRAAALADDVPGDPADRILVATAELLPADLVTKDERLRAVASIRSRW